MEKATETGVIWFIPVPGTETVALRCSADHIRSDTDVHPPPFVDHVEKFRFCGNFLPVLKEDRPDLMSITDRSGIPGDGERFFTTRSKSDLLFCNDFLPVDIPFIHQNQFGSFRFIAFVGKSYGNRCFFFEVVIDLVGNDPQNFRCSRKIQEYCKQREKNKI